MGEDGMESRVDGLEIRVTKLEDNMDNIVMRLLSVENTVLKEGRKQEELLNKLLDHHFSFKQYKWTFYAKMLGGGGIVGTIIYWVIDNIK